MSRLMKHLSLHRINGVELRVVSDVEAGVLPVVQAEEAVIRRYAGGNEPGWPHRWVALLVLQDLQPLVRQLRQRTDPAGASAVAGGTGLPPGGAAALDYRPVVNVYDLADLAGCHVFVNRQAMVREGYWDDPLAVQGLLAHEHAHPLAENDTTRVSRQLQVQLFWADSGGPGAGSRQQLAAASYPPQALRLLTVLADKLCLYAPREVFANEVTIRRGFGAALLHLDRSNVANAGRGVAGRPDLRRQLHEQVAAGTLTPAAAEVLLLIGDLRGYLDLALETAPFYRTGRGSDVQQLEADLATTVFPYLAPAVQPAYVALREQYIALRADLTPRDLVAWSERVLHILTAALAEPGLIIQYRLQLASSNNT